MLSLSMVRAKCYLILQGLERSLSDNLVRCHNLEAPGFLNSTEQERAINRLREDMGDSGWGLEDVKTGDLLGYLDLGDLVQLLNRHKSAARNVRPADVEAATRRIEESGVLGIRKRVMHPVRPLDTEDLPTLMSMPEQLIRDASSLTWDPLHEGARLAESPDGVFGVSFPSFWVDEPAIHHNLPSPEFDDTGFIGRRAERNQLKTLLDSDHSVITVVGAGGVGKTALALRVCHDILEDLGSRIDRIVWVSLKTQTLTPDGIRTISDVVDTVDTLVDRLLSAINITTEINGTPDWERVLDRMGDTRTLLVIDNLETLGSRIRDLAVNIPRESKLLLTSRVGLGEIELRYDMPDLSEQDAILLMRHLGVAYNYRSIRAATPKVLRRYCQRLHYNPLLIKWFVQAVGKGARPEDIFANDDLGQALRFCWQNVFDRLPQLPVEIISTLQAARRSLSRAQLQELVEAGHIEFVQAMQELHRSNIVERVIDQEGGEVYQIGPLVFDYLSRYHPPDDRVVTKTRSKLRQWQIEQDRSAVEQNTYRYNRLLISIESNDQQIAAPYLRNALGLAYAKDWDAAHDSLERARELVPDWSEVYRVRAQILADQGRPISEIEQAFDESLACKATDINRFHYATFLMRTGEFSRALDQIENASTILGADEVSLRSVKGQVLMRSGQIPEALEDLEFVWNSKDARVPRKVKRIQGTQFAEAIRRRVEQLLNLGNWAEAQDEARKGIRLVNEVAETQGWDHKLIEVGADLIYEITSRSDHSGETRSEVLDAISRLESDSNYKIDPRISKKSLDLLETAKHRLGMMTGSSNEVGEPNQQVQYEGCVKFIEPFFGFIETQALGDVHIDRSSLTHPNEWENLQVGQRVVFTVQYGGKGPHAVQLSLLEHGLTVDPT